MKAGMVSNRIPCECVPYCNIPQDLAKSVESEFAFALKHCPSIYYHAFAAITWGSLLFGDVGTQTKP